MTAFDVLRDETAATGDVAHLFAADRQRDIVFAAEIANAALRTASMPVQQ